MALSSLSSISSLFGVSNGFEIILVVLGFVVLLIASWSDVLTHEVPDWINYSFIAAALGIRLVYSSATNDWLVFLSGLAGFALFFGIACLMFYTGQWGGGDSKLLMGVGALFGIVLSIDSGLLAFFSNLLLCGAVYGITYSFFLAFRNWKVFNKEYSKQSKFRAITMFQIASLIVAAVILVVLFAAPDSVPKIPVFFLGILIIFSVHAWVFARSVEKSCMIRQVRPSELTEGDWIVDEIRWKKKYITGPKDLGIGRAQIKRLVCLYNQKKIRKVKIKVGIPFVPAFLAAFVVTLLLSNLFLVFMGLF